METPQEFVVGSMMELFFEIKINDVKVTVMLLSGSAERGGVDLTPNVKYEFGFPQNGSFFTYEGCVLSIFGKVDVHIISQKAPGMAYRNYHQTLQNTRIAAQKKDERGPVVMLVGTSGMSQHAFKHLLLNYALKANHPPVLADLNVGKGALVIPGTIASVFVKEPASVEESFSMSVPLTYQFGQTSPEKNVILYKKLVTKLAERTLNMLDSNKRVKHSGIVINTGGFSKGIGYDLLQHIAESFEVSNIIVFHEELLHEKLRRDLPNFVHVDLLPKYESPPSSSITYKKISLEQRERRLRKYFFGDRTPVQPYMFEVGFEDLKVFHTTRQLMKSHDNKRRLVAVTPTESMECRILALTFAESIQDEIIESIVYGFVCVAAVNKERRTVTVLSPLPGPLPKNILLLSEVKFVSFNNKR